MAKFDRIYPFTTENIAEYMNDLDLKGKKIITVAGSSDHILNAILKGATDITSFDINPLVKKYMDLKVAGIKLLSFEEFLRVFLYETPDSLNSSLIEKLDMPVESKDFWLTELEKRDNKGLCLLKFELFNKKYYNPDMKIKSNLYLSKEKYAILKNKLQEANIDFINCSLETLQLSSYYDYMFLSNISDYLNLMFDKDELVQYRNLIFKFLERVKIIYMAYLYDYNNANPRSDIDNINLIKSVFGTIKIKEIETALDVEKAYIQDAVIILKRGSNSNVRK